MGITKVAQAKEKAGDSLESPAFVVFLKALKRPLLYH
jgi:hypothetical protein